MSATFKLPEPFSDVLPMADLHVWKWADQQADPESVRLRTYLVSHGFRIGTDKVSEADYRTLNHAINHWHWLRVRVLSFPRGSTT